MSGRSSCRRTRLTGSGSPQSELPQRSPSIPHGCAGERRQEGRGAGLLRPPHLRQGHPRRRAEEGKSSPDFQGVGHRARPADRAGDAAEGGPGHGGEGGGAAPQLSSERRSAPISTSKHCLRPGLMATQRAMLIAHYGIMQVAHYGPLRDDRGALARRGCCRSGSRWWSASSPFPRTHRLVAPSNRSSPPAASNSVKNGKPLLN